jgi:predicted transcriptional regulator
MLAGVRYETLFKHYKSQPAIGKALGVTQQAVSRWAKKGVIPPAAALRAQKKTRGKVKVDAAVYA